MRRTSTEGLQRDDDARRMRSEGRARKRSRKRSEAAQERRPTRSRITPEDPWQE
jgi:hypothetical protein